MLVVCSPSARRHLVWPLAESIMTLRMGTHDSGPFPVMGFISSFREFESLASHSFCHVFKGAHQCGIRGRAKGEAPAAMRGVEQRPLLWQDRPAAFRCSHAETGW